MADPEELGDGGPGAREGPSGAVSSDAPEAYAETMLGVGGGGETLADSGTGGFELGPNEDEGADPYIGRVLSGLYKVENRIGEGGMGTVYMALHVHLNKTFAVKVLSPRISSDRQAVERLRQEAIAASSIDHENIVNVVNFDATDDGEVFIVMELLQGKSLAEFIEEGPLSLERAVPIVYQLCQALGAAHERGIVHRDLKPENIFVVRKRDMDVAKVLDFGISKVKSAEAEQVRMTKTGQLVGTPLYMSPEQAKGESDVDRRADIYALGVILYEMLVGEPPFEGMNYFQLLWKHGNEAPVPPSEKSSRSTVPHAVDQVILKALAKKPDDRYQTMQALEDALAAAVPDIPVSHAYLSRSAVRAAARATGLPLQKRWLALSAVALLAIGAGVGGVALRKGSDGPAPAAEAPLASTPGPGDVAVEQPPSEEPRPSPRGEPDPVPAGVEPPVPLSMELVTDPPGAQAFLGDTPLGETPLAAVALPPSEAPVVIRFEKRGYRTALEPVVPADGESLRVRLRPKRRTGSSRPSIPIKQEL